MKKNIYKLVSMVVAFLMILTPITLKAAPEGSELPPVGEIYDQGMLTIYKFLNDSHGNFISEPRAFELNITGPSYPEGARIGIFNGIPLVINNLKYGNYIVTETPVEGYETAMWPDGGEVWVGIDNPAVLEVWNTEKEVLDVGENGILWIHKYLMNASGTPVMESREFTMKVTGPSYPEGQEFKVMSGDKLMLEGLMYGEYTIVELNAEGYMVNMMPTTGKVMVGEMPAELKIWNREKMVMEDKGMLTIHKYLKDSEGNIITEPMKFEVHVTGPSYPEGEHFEIMNGTPLVLKDLKYGKYTVEETAVEGYKTTMWPENGEVWVQMFHPATLKIWNMKEEIETGGAIKIPNYLLNVHGIPIEEGRSFTLKVTGPSYPEGKVFNITSGEISMFRGLSYGDYSIQELDADGHIVTMYPRNGVVTVGLTPVTILVLYKEKGIVHDN